MIGRLLERFQNPLDQLPPDLRSVYTDTLASAKDPGHLATTLDGIEQIEAADPEFNAVFDKKGLERQWDKLGATMMDAILAEDIEPALQTKAIELYARALTTVKEGAGSVVDKQLRRAANSVPRDELAKRPALSAQHERVQELFKAIFDQYGLDFYTTWEAWQDNYSRPGRLGGVDADVMRRFHSVQNFFALRQIEHRKPGTAKLLQERFGVFQYERYPTDLLVSQVEYSDDKDTPYGVVISAHDDNNGALAKEQPFLKSLHDQLQGRYHVRIVECASKIELAKRLLRLEVDYQQPASFAVVSAHGNVDKVRLGTGDSGLILIKDVVHPTFVKGSQRFLQPDAQVILTGCLTGRPEGIAEQYATANARVAHAANHDVTSVRSVKIDFPDDQPPTFKLKMGGRIAGLSWSTRVIDARNPE